MGCCCNRIYIDEDQEQPTRIHHGDNSKGQSTSSPQKLTDKNISLHLKEQGNAHFKNKEYKLAIVAYQKAISLPNPDISYYSNLALAYKANKQYKQSILIVDQMIRSTAFHTYQHSELFRKGQIIKSRCMIILVKEYCLDGKYSQSSNQQKLIEITNAINFLEELMAVPNTQLTISDFLESGRKVKQFLTEEIIARSHSENVITYFQKKLKDVKINEQLSKFYSSPTQILKDLKDAVKKQQLVALDEENDYLVDPITYQVFKDPVVLPSGLSFDADILKEHFKNNGYNDPITHQAYKLGQQVLIRNNCLKNLIKETRSGMNKDELHFLKY